MEQKEDEESLNLEDNSNVKSKLDWSHLTDIESLITEMNSGKKVRCIVYDTETTGVNHKKKSYLRTSWCRSGKLWFNR